VLGTSGQQLGAIGSVVSASQSSQLEAPRAFRQPSSRTPGSSGAEEFRACPLAANSRTGRVRAHRNNSYAGRVRLGFLPSGCDQRTAASIAALVGIDRVLAEVLPADKVDEVRRLQDERRVVAMVTTTRGVRTVQPSLPCDGSRPGSLAAVTGQATCPSPANGSPTCWLLRPDLLPPSRSGYGFSRREESPRRALGRAGGRNRPAHSHEHVGHGHVPRLWSSHARRVVRVGDPRGGCRSSSRLAHPAVAPRARCASLPPARLRARATTSVPGLVAPVARPTLGAPRAHTSGSGRCRPRCG